MSNSIPSKENSPQSLRILQVVEASSGGVGRHVIDLSLGLLKRGHYVEVAYSKARSDQSFKLGLKEIESLGGKIFNLEISSNISGKDIKAIMDLRKRLREGQKLDVIHGQSSKAGFVARMAARDLDIKKIYTPHLLRTASPGLGRLGKVIFGMSERFLARYSDRIICVSKFEQNHAIEMGLPENLLVYCPIGHDDNSKGLRADIRQSLGVLEDEILFGFVGRLVVQKDPITALTGFQIVRENVKKSKLLIIGDGPLENMCKEKVQGAGIDQSTIFLGNKDASHYLNAIDILVLSSLSESFPRVILEAGLAKIPVVVSPVGDLKEIIQDGLNGFFANVGDSQSFASQMMTLAESKELRDKLGNELYKTVSEFSIDTMVDRTIQIYRDTLVQNTNSPKS